MYNKIEKLYQHFNMKAVYPAGPLTDKHYRFRCKAMFEELFEYCESVFNCNTDGLKSQMFTAIDMWSCNILGADIDSAETRKALADQFDALLDLTTFALGTMYLQGFPVVEGFDEVMRANMAKEVGTNAKRGNFKIDLIKPKDWKAPDLQRVLARQMVGDFRDNSPPIFSEREPLHTLTFNDDFKPPKVTGLIILDGADASGKTTLANHFVKAYGAEYIHLTWSEELEKRMQAYMYGELQHAITISSTKLCVVDRLWLSELIYAEVYRDGSKRYALHDELRHDANQAKAINVICHIDNANTWWKVFKHKSDNGTEMYAADTRVRTVHSLYSYHCRKLLRKYPADYFQYDFTRNEINEFASGIINKLKEGQKNVIS